MSVRDGLLALLTIGPAYGLQLHAELMTRAAHRKPVNVGQVYATLDRLTSQGLVMGSGSTADGLPLYAATPHGVEAAERWMASPETDPLPEWTEMLDQVLITSTVHPVRAVSLVTAYRRWWELDLADTRTRLSQAGTHAGSRLALLAREAQGVAALAWLSAASSDLAELDTAQPFSPHRPKRGRRPVQSP